MKNRKLGSLICLILVLTVFIPAIAHAERPVRVPVIIGFKGAPDLDLVAAFDGKIKYVYTIIPAIALDLPEVAVSGIAKAKGVAYVEPDYVFEALGETLPWGVDHIDAEVVHTYPNKGSGVQIAIIDTGIDYDHPDLASNYEGGYDFVNEDFDPMDDNGHGTHCAGIVAAVDNDYGVIGVAPEVGLYALKVLDSSGRGYISDIIAGIEWAVNGSDGIEGTGDDAEVISMSLGGSQGTTSLEAACDHAYASGTLIVAAAGNNGNPPGIGDKVLYPARYASVIAVAATNTDDERAGWSSTGPDVELSAPGVSINSTYWDDTYAIKSGTSMACPHVSGVAALVYNSTITDGYDSNDNEIWDANEIRKKMDDTAIDLGPTGRDEKYGYGLVSAVAAVDKPEVHDIAVTNIEAPTWVVQDGAVNVNVTVENQGSFNETFDVVLMDETDGVHIGTQLIELPAAGASTIVSFSWNTTEASLVDHTLNATAGTVPDETDTADNSMSIVVTIKEPSRDVAVTSITAPSSVYQGDMVSVDVDVANEGTFDETFDVVLTNETGSVPIGSETVSLVVGASTTVSFSWNTSSSTLGEHTLTATAGPVTDETDTADNSLSTTVTVEETPSGDVNDMYVWDISFSEKRFGRDGSKIDLMTTVTIQRDSDADGIAELEDELVSTAAVYMTLTLAESDESWNFKGDTDDYGQVTFTLKFAPKGDYEAKVTNVTHGTYTYESTLDEENPDNYIIG